MVAFRFAARAGFVIIILVMLWPYRRVLGIDLDNTLVQVSTFGVFTLASGARCRTWDDFLTVSAQRWPAMRDELVSGRLAAFLASIGRGDMGPLASAPGTPDERLDAWLGTLPATRPSRPELDVHPAAVKLRAAPGGGIMRASVQLTNTGYRLLRTDVRVEPASATWLKIPAPFAQGPIVTVEASTCLNADCTNKTTPVGTAVGRLPRFSPDGSSIAFVDDSGLNVMLANGQSQKLVYPASEIHGMDW